MKCENLNETRDRHHLNNVNVRVRKEIVTDESETEKNLKRDINKFVVLL